MVIAQGVFQVGGQGFTSPEDASVYLIEIGGRAALIDAGCGGSRKVLLENIRNCGVDSSQIDYLLITHCHFDHTGGAAVLRQQLSLKTVAHELDAAYLETGDDSVTAATWYGAAMTPVPVDVKLTGAEAEIPLGDGVVHALHTPGHSPGSVVYYFESDGKRVLFGQDIHGPLDPRLLSNRSDYKDSLRRIRALEADILCEGHFGIFHGKSAVRRFINGFLADG